MKTPEELEANIFKKTLAFGLGVIYGSVISTVVTLSITGVPDFDQIKHLLP